MPNDLRLMGSLFLAQALPKSAAQAGLVSGQINHQNAQHRKS
jgi:hypothetical protein